MWLPWRTPYLGCLGRWSSPMRCRGSRPILCARTWHRQTPTWWTRCPHRSCQCTASRTLPLCSAALPTAAAAAAPAWQRAAAAPHPRHPPSAHRGTPSVAWTSGWGSRRLHLSSSSSSWRWLGLRRLQQPLQQQAQPLPACRRSDLQQVQGLHRCCPCPLGRTPPALQSRCVRQQQCLCRLTAAMTKWERPSQRRLHPQRQQQLQWVMMQGLPASRAPPRRAPR
jgi:hypothetical protein